MQANLHFTSGNQFTNYSATMVAVNKIEYSQNLLVTANRIQEINIQSLTEINWEYLNQIVDVDNLDLIIFGTADKIVPLEKSLQQQLQQQHIGYEVMPIPAMCRTFNYLSAEARNVLALVLF